jgi:hypothetical protein
MCGSLRAILCHLPTNLIEAAAVHDCTVVVPAHAWSLLPYRLQVEPTLDAENGAGVPLDQLSWQADVLGSVQRGLLQGAHRVQTVVRNSAAKPKPKGHIKHTHGRKLMSEVRVQLWQTQCAQALP